VDRKPDTEQDQGEQQDRDYEQHSRLLSIGTLLLPLLQRTNVVVGTAVERAMGAVIVAIGPSDQLEQVVRPVRVSRLPRYPAADAAV